MDQLIVLFVYVIVFAVIVGGVVYVCKALSVPQVGQWVAAAVIIVALLLALASLVGGGGRLHLPTIR